MKRNIPLESGHWWWWWREEMDGNEAEGDERGQESTDTEKDS